MCKKSLRTAIHLHERLTEGRYECGSYNGAKGDDRKAIFNAKLLELEPILRSCPFCGVVPTYRPANLSSGGLSAGFLGNCASVECKECDIEFKGSMSSKYVAEQWNSRFTD